MSPSENPELEAAFATPPDPAVLLPGAGVAVAVAMKLAHDCCVANGTVEVPAVEPDPK